MQGCKGVQGGGVLWGGTVCHYVNSCFEFFMRLKQEETAIGSVVNQCLPVQNHSPPRLLLMAGTPNITERENLWSTALFIGD